MKKVIIAGAASVALAAMPVLGTFADNPSQLVDNVTVEVESGCTIEKATNPTPGQYPARTFEANIVAGTNEVLRGSEGGAAAPTMTVKCNTDAGTFTITASGTALTAKDQSETVIGTIGSGTAVSGNTSAWAYSLDDGTSWDGAPVAAGTEVVKNQTITETGYSFAPIYRVYVAPNEKPGNYIGSITYTVAVD